MDFRLLGPVEVWAGGYLADVGPPLQRGVLAVLAVDASRPVPLRAMIDRVWGHTAPSCVRNAVYVYVSRLRRVLDQVGAGETTPARVVRRSSGYLLDIAPECVDVHRFRALVNRARDPRRTNDEQARLLWQALDLWRGDPLADVPGDWAVRVGEGWQQLRHDAMVSWAQAEMRRRNAVAVIGPLVEMVGRYPLAESLVAVLMRALHAAGQSAQALHCFASARLRLVEQLGVEPGAELHRLHQAILRDDLDEDYPAGECAPAPSMAVTSTAPPWLTPALLPPDVPRFVGRVGEVNQLNAGLAAAREYRTAMVIFALSGTAGVGKSALAVHWAHQVADQFPDGQLYVNLRGFDPAFSAVSPAEAIRGFLDALWVPARDLPTDLDAQVGLYRSLLAGRRVLVVLDNARDAEQVRPLLPGSSACLVMVASRTQLTSLVAVEGARPLELALPTREEARALLAGRLGRARTTADHEAIDEIVTHSARLPLALVIVAARAVTRPECALATLADELRAARGSLDAFDGGDPPTNLRTVFSWSYRTLSAASAQLFRLLGRQPGAEIELSTVAGLVGATRSQTRQLLAELCQAHLLEERADGRYALHDLLYAYAAELAADG